jgi:hypothetical protein
MALCLRPISIRDAKNFVTEHHRHNKAPQGAKFAIAVENNDEIVGVALVGRPVARKLQDGYTGEVLRVCTTKDSPKNVCSMLYGACNRAWKAMGGRRLVTYTLCTETGTSLLASGWQITGETIPPKNPWQSSKDQTRKREMQKIYAIPKNRWEPELQSHGAI